MRIGHRVTLTISRIMSAEQGQAEFTIEITYEHIGEGEAQEGAKCPIALALLDAGLRNPQVGPETVSFDDDEQHYAYDLPPEAVAFVEQFDALKTVSAFTLKLKQQREA